MAKKLLKNKHKKTGITFGPKLSAYLQKLSNKKKPQITQIICDKIAVTINVPDHSRDDVVESLKEYHLQDVLEKFKYKATKPYVQSQYYALSLKLFPEEDKNTVILIQALPKKPNTAFMRLEWNPHRVGKIGHEVIKDVLTYTIHHESGDKYLYGSKITSLDIAADIANVSVDRLGIDGYKNRKRRMYINSKGKIETVYLGTADSEIKIYDRKAHEAAQKKKGKPLKTPIEYSSMTRVEMTVSDTDFLKLGQLENPFKKLKLYDLDHPNFLQDIGLNKKEFYAVWQLRGIEFALETTNDLSKNLARKRINAFKTDFWNDEVLEHHWKSWLGHLFNTGLLPTLD